MLTRPLLSPRESIIISVYETVLYDPANELYGAYEPVIVDLAANAGSGQFGWNTNDSGFDSNELLSDRRRQLYCTSFVQCADAIA